MKLFTVGPVNMFDYTLKTAGMQLPYFRTHQFSDVIYEINDLFKTACNAPKDSEVFVLTASGTAAMEATVLNCFNENTKVLIVSGGTFGKRFEELCELHNIPYDVVRVPLDKDLTEEMLNLYKENEYFAMLINKHETGIGKLYDSKLISDFCKTKNMYLIVDAISTLFADKYDMSELGADLTFVSSQKALALTPGITVVAVTKRLYENVIVKNKKKTLYFDFVDCVVQSRRGQTPFTPAVGIMFQLRERLQKIVEYGVEKEIERTNDLATYFRSKVKNIPFSLPKYTLSNCITPISSMSVNTRTLFEILKDEYDLVALAPNDESVLRIGHIGNLVKEDYDELIDKINIVVERLKK